MLPRMSPAKPLPRPIICAASRPWSRVRSQPGGLPKHRCGERYRYELPDARRLRIRWEVREEAWVQPPVIQSNPQKSLPWLRRAALSRRHVPIRPTQRSGKLSHLLQRHSATMKCQFDAFAEYVAEAEREGTAQYPLYEWTKATIEDPVKKKKHLQSFSLHVNGKGGVPPRRSRGPGGRSSAARRGWPDHPHLEARY